MPVPCELLGLHFCLLYPTSLENMSVSVALLACWDMFLIPRMLQEQLQTVEQLTDHVAIGNLNCELRFIPNPVRGEGSEEGG